MAEKNTDQRLLEFLIAEFETMYLDPNDPRAGIGQEIIDRYKKDPYSYCKSDIYKLDTLILSMQPTERLVQRAETLRLKYMELAGAKISAAYHPVPVPTSDKFDDKATRNLLLADLQQILQFIHWGYFFIPIREKIRNDVIRHAAITMSVCTLVWGALLAAFIYYDHSFFGMLITVVYAGLMGGFISSQRRMQMIPTQGDPLSSIYELENGKYFFWFAPLTGAVFSIILMLLFISGVVSGSIFPKFAEPTQVVQAVEGADWKFLGVLPLGVANYALLFLWSFIAGFAERFVPDALDRLISRGAAIEVGGEASIPPRSADELARSVKEPEGKEGIRPEEVPPAQMIVTPQVKSLQPTTGSTSGGTEVEITGTGFIGGETSVSFGSTPAQTIAINDTQITAISPPGEGTVNVTVTSGGGSSPNVPASLFTYEGGSDEVVDDENDTHICDMDVPIQVITSDEELPVAEGGVA